jgi:hypothetical protein
MQATEVPTIVMRCIDWLENGPKGLEQEGLYRIPGKAAAIKEFKTHFNDKADYEFPEGTNVNWVASLLKQYLRELPELVRVPPTALR